MFATRDQENVIHGHQTAGAAKATNLTRQLQPKTPGAKAPKKPFKVPLNDENNTNAFGAGKSTLKTVGKGNENVTLGGKKNGLLARDAFKTPMVARAPLGQKTTNAKAKGHSVLVPSDNDLAKSRQKSASARKRGPRISHAEPVKIDVLSEAILAGDDDDESLFDIGVTHPRPADLDDFAGELPELDLTMLSEGPIRSGVYRDMLEHDPLLDGMSMNELRRRQDAEDRRVRMEVCDVTCYRDVEISQPMPCRHEPECSGWECRDEPARRRRVEEECAKEVAAIRASWQIIDRFKYFNEAQARLDKSKADSASSLKAKKPTAIGPRIPKSTVIPLKPSSVLKAPRSTSGPSTTMARSAASKLATQPPTAIAPTRAAVAPPKSRYPAALSRNPTNAAAAMPSAQANAARHASARAVSNTTLGYAKGRAASAQMRGTVLPRSDRNVFAPPQPESGAEANEEADEAVDEETLALDQALMEEAMQDFVLPMPVE